MSLNLKEVSEFMISYDYLLPLGQGKYKLSTKFYREMREYSKLPVKINTVPVHRPTVGAIGREEAYKRFIEMAQVPARLENQRGDTYAANTYSEKGMKAFDKAIAQGYDFDLLVKATMLYYKSSLRFKVAIGRFVEEGIWRTYYDSLQQAASEGESQLTNHIKQELEDGTTDRYALG